MKRPLFCPVLFLLLASCCGFATEARSIDCFLADFDRDGDPWTIETLCLGDTCAVSFILEATADSPAGRTFTIIVNEGCCDVGWDGFYGTRVEVTMSPDLIDAWTATYSTCTCCSDWYIDGHFRDDAVFVPGQRYVIGSGTAVSLCDDTWWLCDPPHTFSAEYLVEHEAPCTGNTVEMTLLCSGSSVSDDPDLFTARLGPPAPNPVMDRLRYTVILPEESAVRVRVFDASGAAVATLVDGALPAGSHERWWRPASARGSRLASGIYFLRLDAPGVRASRPFVVAH